VWRNAAQSGRHRTRLPSGLRRREPSALEALIAEDFHFTNPLDHRIDRETCFARY
jgi:hypothetical protein